MTEGKGVRYKMIEVTTYIDQKASDRICRLEVGERNQVNLGERERCGKTLRADQRGGERCRIVCDVAEKRGSMRHPSLSQYPFYYRKKGYKDIVVSSNLLPSGRVVYHHGRGRVVSSISDGKGICEA
jgi:hypothetical protein